MFGGFYSGKTVWVTGHTGFKGAWLSQWLQHLGARLVARTPKLDGARLRTFIRLGPTFIGVALIPLMPLFDAPIEHLMEGLFDRVWPLRHAFSKEISIASMSPCARAKLPKASCSVASFSSMSWAL